MVFGGARKFLLPTLNLRKLSLSITTMKTLLALLLIAASVTSGRATGELDLTFVPQLFNSGNVQLVSRVPGGKTLVAGYFDWINGQPADWLARLNADGSVDSTFNPERPPMLERVVLAVPQADGKILLGYSFALKMYAMAAAAPPTLTPTIVTDPVWFDSFGAKLRRLNADGSLDASFAEVTFGIRSSANVSFDETLKTAVPQADGSVIVGGSFGGVNGVTLPWLARIKSDGTLDTAFQTTVNGSVDTAMLCGDGCIVIGGQFTSINKAKLAFGLARLKRDGTRDGTFKPTGKLRGHPVQITAGQNNTILLATITDSPRGKGGAATAASTANIERVGPKGGNVQVLASSIIGTPTGISLIGNGQALMVTNTANNDAFVTTSSSTARLMAPGMSVFVDASSNKNKPKVVSLGFRPNGFYRANGSIIGYGSSGADAGATPSMRGFELISPPVAAATTAAAPLFAPPAPAELPWVGSTGSVNRIAAVPGSDQIITAGWFSFGLTSNGDIVSRQGLARLNADGSVDEAFTPAYAYDVFHLLADVGGGVTFIGQARSGSSPHLMRMTSSGAQDVNFTFSEVTNATCLARATDGTLYVGRSVFDSSGVTPVVGTLNGTVTGGTTTVAPAPRSAAAASSSAGLITSGSGTLILTNGATYAGNTQVSAGSLTVANTTGSATGTGTITVSNSAPLISSGLIMVAGRPQVELNSTTNVLNVFDWTGSSNTNAITVRPIPLPSAPLWIFSATGYYIGEGSFVRGLPSITLTGPDVAGTYSIDHVFPEAGGAIVITGNFSKVNGVARAGIARLKADRTLDTDAFATAPPVGFSSVLPRGTGYLLTAPQLNYSATPINVTPLVVSSDTTTAIAATGQGLIGNSATNLLTFSEQSMAIQTLSADQRLKLQAMRQLNSAQTEQAATNASVLEEPIETIAVISGGTHVVQNQSEVIAPPPAAAADASMIAMPIFINPPGTGSTRSPFYAALASGVEDTTFSIADLVTDPNPTWSWTGPVFGVQNIVQHPSGGWVAMTRGLKDKTTDKAVAFVRVNADGSIDHSVVDPSFGSAPQDGGAFMWWGPRVAADFVEDMVVLSDGSVVVAGTFWSVNGEARNGIAKFKF